MADDGGKTDVIDPGEGSPSGRAVISELDTFSDEFNRFETDHALFESLVDAQGFAWWDLARYSVQFAICTERGILGQRHVDASSSLTRAGRAATRAATIARTQMALATFFPRTVQTQGGRSDLFVYSRLTPVLRQALEESSDEAVRVGMAVPGAGRASNGLTKKGLEALAAVRARFVSCPDEISREAVRLDGLLKEAFGSQIDFAALIAGKYRAHLVDLVIWPSLLDQLPQAGTLHFINDDTTRTLTALAKARGMTTREYQHAYMGRSHFAYNHPPQACGLATLADEILVHRDTGDIVVPTRLVPVDEPGRPSPTGSRDIDVLVGGSPVNNNEAQAIIASLADRGFSVAIKLHPAQTLASSGMRSRFPAEALAIFEGKDDFAELAVRSQIYIPANPSSTTSFEAAELGAKLVVVDFGGRRMTNAIDDLIAARVDDVAELPALVSALLKQDQGQVR